jgi:hypothetical protein
MTTLGVATALALGGAAGLLLGRPVRLSDRVEALTGGSLRRCPLCHHGQMIAAALSAGRGIFPAVINTS